MWWLGFLLGFQDAIHVDLVEKVSRVTFSLRVQDEQGRMPKLKESDVELYENGTKLPILHFEQKNLSGSLLLLFDLSASQENDLPRAIALARSLIHGKKNTDEIALAFFSGEYRCFQEFTQDRALLEAALDQLEILGSSALLDGMAAALRDLVQRPGPKALVVFSDGHDLISRTKERELGALTRSLGIPIFFWRQAEKPASYFLLRAQIDFLEELCRTSGGAFLIGSQSRDLSRMVQYQFLRYELAYEPPNPENTEMWRAITLQIPSCSDCKMEYRRGFRLVE